MNTKPIEYHLKDKTAQLEEVTLIDGVLTIKFKDQTPQQPTYPKTLPTEALIEGWYGPKGYRLQTHESREMGYRLQTHESREIACCCCGAPILAGTQHARWTIPGNPLPFHPGKPQDDPYARAAHPGCLWLAFPGGRPGYSLPEGFKPPEGLIHYSQSLGVPPPTKAPDQEPETSNHVKDLQPIHLKGDGIEFLLFFKVIRTDPSIHAKIGAFKHTHCTDMPWREFTRGTDCARQVRELVQEECKQSLHYGLGVLLTRILESL